MLSNSYPRSEWAPPKRLFTALKSLFIVLTLTHITYYGFICDDAMITFRNVLNLVYRNGFVYNITERVQSFTNPLFALAIAVLFLVTNELFYTTIAFSVFLSAICLYLLFFKFDKNNSFLAIPIFLALLLSKSFTEFSTSGMENPLVHLFLLLSLFAFIKQKGQHGPSFALFAFFVSCAFITRMDSAVLLLPLVVASLWRCKNLWSIISWGILGALPAIAWLAFATIYYGFPFPNTAYAKLNGWYSSSYYTSRGIRYFQDSLWRDAVTLPVSFTIIFLSLYSRRLIPICIALGALLYYYYIVKIGGDFMSGRFFSAPLLLVCCAVFFWNREKLQSWMGCSIAAIAILAYGTYSGAIPFNMWSTTINVHGPDDIRLVNYTRFSLASPKVRFLDLSHWNNVGEFETPSGAQRYITGVGVMRGAGEAGLVTGPHFYLIDMFALTDPLLARLPALNRKLYGTPQIGHLKRAIPAGYTETRETGVNQIKDDYLKYFYSLLERVIAREIWSRERFKYIWKLNIGDFDDLIDRDLYRSPENFNPDLVRTWDNEGKPITILEEKLPAPRATWEKTMTKVCDNNSGEFPNLQQACDNFHIYTDLGY